MKNIEFKLILIFSVIVIFYNVALAVDPFDPWNADIKRSIGEAPYAIYADKDYVWYLTWQNFRRLPLDLSGSPTTQAYGSMVGGVGFITSNDTYVFLNTGDAKILRYTKSSFDNLTETSASNYRAFAGMVGDDNYLYATNNSGYVFKINVSDMSVATSTPSAVAPWVIGMERDENYLYITDGANPNRIHQIPIQTLTDTSTHKVYDLESGTIQSPGIHITSDYVFIPVSDSGRKIRKLDRSLIGSATSPVVEDSFSYGSSNWDTFFVGDEENLYVANRGTRRISHLLTSDITTQENQAEQMGGKIYIGGNNTDYLYSTSEVTDAIWRFPRPEYSPYPASNLTILFPTTSTTKDFSNYRTTWSGTGFSGRVQFRLFDLTDGISYSAQNIDMTFVNFEHTTNTIIANKVPILKLGNTYKLENKLYWYQNGNFTEIDHTEIEFTITETGYILPDETTAISELDDLWQGTEISGIFSAIRTRAPFSYFYSFIEIIREVASVEPKNWEGINIEFGELGSGNKLEQEFFTETQVKELLPSGFISFMKTIILAGFWLAFLGYAYQRISRITIGGVS